MIGLAIIFTLVAAIALLTVPRRWAPVPFLLGACYMTMGQKIDLGPASLDMVRILIAAGVLRVTMRGERIAGGMNTLDKVMLVWAGWAVISSAFHDSSSDGNPFIFRCGLVYNVLGIYFLFRCFIQTREDTILLVKVTACILVPVAAAMLQEHATKRNLFSVFGGVSEFSVIRLGKLRAQGPFAHPILGGTVGAVTLPYMIGLYKQSPRIALVGIAACVTMVLASNSSGPLMSGIFGVFAILLWRWRHQTRQMRIGLVVGYILLDIVMKAPAYYIIARIDLTGGSTGWHRAHLIEMALDHLGEWWFAGTDYTRHWMPTGVSWSPNHTDITNHYLQYGVLGGLPLMGLFIAALGVGFRFVGDCLRAVQDEEFPEQFFVWSTGAALLTQVATCISVSFFDQSYVFIFMNLALIASLRAALGAEAAAETEESPHDQDSIHAGEAWQQSGKGPAVGN